MSSLALFATEQGSGEDGEFLAIFLVAALIGLALQFGFMIVVCNLLKGPLEALPAKYRQIEPGMVWLLLIPFFNYYWNFVVFLKTPDSFKAYFDAQGRTDVGDCGRELGRVFSICAVMGLVPIVHVIAGPLSLVMAIKFLIKTHQLNKKVTGVA